MVNTAFLTLTQWLSPAYPVGSFTYSHGLEWAIQNGDISDAPTAAAWIEYCVLNGSGRNDAILLSNAYLSDEIEPVAELAIALCSSKERLAETMDQGAAFAKTTSAISGFSIPRMPYPVAVAYAAKAKDIPLDLTLAAYLQSFSANLVSAAVRYVPLGQTQGQAISAALHAAIEELATFAETACLDDIGSCAFRSDMASMKHETQTTRLFKS